MESAESTGGTRPASESPPAFTLFLLSPAFLGGERAALVVRPQADFALAQQLRSPEGAPLGELFSFLSGLYFRGKVAYAQAFGRSPEGLPPALVISPGEGLRFLHERITLERLRGWAEVPIDEHNPRFTEPLLPMPRRSSRRCGGARASCCWAASRRTSTCCRSGKCSESSCCFPGRSWVGAI